MYVPIKTKTVGDYYFYLVRLGNRKIYAMRYYYYLYRVHNGQEEIMQYYSFHVLESVKVNPGYFDDIHVR